jgi:hypothetical protein
VGLQEPLHGEIGLSSALRWYVDGFSERSKIKVNLDLPEGVGRSSREMELTIFRMDTRVPNNRSSSFWQHLGGDTSVGRKSSGEN